MPRSGERRREVKEAVLQACSAVLPTTNGGAVSQVLGKQAGSSVQQRERQAACRKRRG